MPFKLSPLSAMLAPLATAAILLLAGPGQAWPDKPDHPFTEAWRLPMRSVRFSTDGALCQSFMTNEGRQSVMGQLAWKEMVKIASPDHPEIILRYFVSEAEIGGRKLSFIVSPGYNEKIFPSQHVIFYEGSAQSIRDAATWRDVYWSPGKIQTVVSMLDLRTGFWPGGAKFIAHETIQSDPRFKDLYIWSHYLGLAIPFEYQGRFYLVFHNTVRSKPEEGKPGVGAAVYAIGENLDLSVVCLFETGTSTEYLDPNLPPLSQRLPSRR